MQLIIGLLFILIIQGCNSSESSQTQNGLVNDAVSMTRTDSHAIISKDAMNHISIEIGDLLKINLTSFNQQEAISFNQETSYCDISGLKESLTSNKSETISNTIYSNNCKETESIQNGKINFEYIETDEDGKCPQCFTLKIEQTYTFNNLTLLDDVLIEGDVNYNKDGSIQQINFKINGNVSYKAENYELQNITQSMNY
jgi:hypothetical protein